MHKHLLGHRVLTERGFKELMSPTAKWTFKMIDKSIAQRNSYHYSNAFKLKGK